MEKNISTKLHGISIVYKTRKECCAISNKKTNKVNTVKTGSDSIPANKILFTRNSDKAGLVHNYNIFMDMEGFKEKS